MRGVQLSRVTEKLNEVTDGGRRKLNGVTDEAAGERSAGSHFQPYRTRIGSHNLSLATACVEYAVHIPNICTYTATRFHSK